MPSSLARDFPKCDVKQGSLLDMIQEGSPN